MPGEVFGPYELLTVLGAGGMGEVWRARDTRKDRIVALKLLGAWLGADPDYTARFRREAALVARLSAPTIVPIHDYGEIDGRLFIDMPLIEGADLGVILARTGPLPAPRAVGIVEQIADALDTAHAAGLIHRDVKPSNVLVSTRRTGRDVAYLIDFGVARQLSDTQLTATGHALGTLAYMAPERFAGTGDHRGDVYALACLLQRMLTGRAPFVAPADGLDAALFYLNAHVNRTPPAVSSLVPTLPRAMDAVIARGMAKDPDVRFPSAGELSAAAAQALDDAVRHRRTTRPAGVPDHVSDPVTRRVPPTAADPVAVSRAAAEAQEPTRTEHVGTPTPRRRKRRLPAALASVAVLAVVAGWLGAQYLTSRPSRTADLLRLPGTHGEVAAVTTALLDGRTVVVAGGQDQSLHVWELAGGAPVGAPLAGAAGEITAIATTDVNGRPAVVAGSRGATLRVWDLATGAPVGPAFAGHAGRDSSPVSAVTTAQLGGRTVVGSAAADSLCVWDAASGATIWCRSVSTSAATIARRDGHPVLVAAEVDITRDDTTLRMLDLATGTQVGPVLTLPSYTSPNGSVLLSTVRSMTVAEADGRTLLVAGAEDDAVHVWDLATGALVGSPFTGHAHTVSSVATAQWEGRTVVVSASSETVRVWDPLTGAERRRPYTGEGRAGGSIGYVVLAVATAELDGRPVVLSGGYFDSAVHVWPLDD